MTPKEAYKDITDYFEICPSDHGRKKLMGILESLSLTVIKKEIVTEPVTENDIVEYLNLPLNFSREKLAMLIESIDEQYALKERSNKSYKKFIYPLTAKVTTELIPLPGVTDVDFEAELSYISHLHHVPACKITKKSGTESVMSAKTHFVRYLVKKYPDLPFKLIKQFFNCHHSNITYLLRNSNIPCPLPPVKEIGKRAYLKQDAVMCCR